MNLNWSTDIAGADRQPTNHGTGLLTLYQKRRCGTAFHRCIGLLLFISIIAHAQTLESHKIQVLIITGQDKHPWREASPYLKDLLNQTGKFEVRVTEEFRGSTAETLKPYDVAVLVYSDEKLNIPEWSATTKEALLDFVRSGRGLVVYHHSAASFQQWAEYKSLVGCVWRTGISHHAPVHDYKVDIRDAAHPITHGMAPSFLAHT